MSTFTFDDLLLWSERLPDWQRDALRRVLTGTLTTADIAELSEMAKAAGGLSKPSTPSPCPPATSDIRSSGASRLPVALLAIRNITYVNALASGPITFAPDGLTIIYGDNASGKSGITRILKKAGRARNPGGPIRPSVFEPDPGKPATATIEFRAGTADRSFSWVDGSATDNELTGINVFDASSAAVQIEENNRLTYTPEILQVFQDLAEACHAVGARLKAEHDALNSARPPEIERLNLRPHTAAGILIAKLSTDTNLADIDALCNVTATDRERFNNLKNALQDNPILQADLLEARARRLNELDDLTAKLESILSDPALRDFETLLSDAAAADEAAKAASQAFAANSALGGIGTAAWKQLWESARRYSQTLAYPSEPFPLTREDALCVLCQQSIAGTASQRLRRKPWSRSRFVAQNGAISGRSHDGPCASNPVHPRCSSASPVAFQLILPKPPIGNNAVHPPQKDEYLLPSQVGESRMTVTRTPVPLLRRCLPLPQV